MPTQSTDPRSLGMEEEQPLNAATILGLLVGAAALVATPLGILVPLIFWIVSGALGIATLALGVFAQPPMRRWILIAGAVAMIPILIFALIHALPRAMG